MVVLGHIYPIFFGFKGGKGVATLLGVVLALSWVLGLIALMIWLFIFKTTKISSLSAIISVILTPIFAYLILGNSTYFGTILIVCVFVLYTHKGNIHRIITGQEHNFKKNK
jgi:glycerol-3-phosphate acyltransferase PlsY